MNPSPLNQTRKPNLFCAPKALTPKALNRFWQPLNYIYIRIVPLNSLTLNPTPYVDPELF